MTQVLDRPDIEGNMQRKGLATIQRIASLSPIPGADAIECAIVQGWQCVVKKGEFKEGDLCVYFEIDSVLPDGPEWSEFMRPHHFRVKTVRLRGQISQGLALPYQIAAEVDPFAWVGDDESEALGVTKYAPPEASANVSREHLGAPFPGSIPKTDEHRIQSAIDALADFHGKPYYVTQKMDGTSATFCHDGLNLNVYSRNWQVKDGDNHYWRMARKYDLANVLAEYPSLAVQGEICGPGIQKNRMGLPELTLYVFDAYDIRDGRYLSDSELGDVCAIAGLQRVPVLDAGIDFNMTLDDLAQMAARHAYPNGHPQEGIVVRCDDQHVYCHALGGRPSFKYINPEYLLKTGE